MTEYNPRNWQGYAGQAPSVEWPGDTVLAVNLVLNYEEGSERNILDGDESSESYLSGFSGLPARKGQRHFSSESLFAYGSRSGCWRLLSLFKEYDLPVTVFACGQALERNPAFAGALGNSPHEVAGHGYRWIDYQNFSIESEWADMQKTLKTISRLTGKNPVGWYTGRKSPHTRKLVIEAGLIYDSDDYSDDYPWWLSTGNQHHLIIPYSLINNDCRYCTSPGWNTPNDFFLHLKSTFDGLYRHSHSQPNMLTLGLHSRLSGHPGRCEAVRQFIDYVLEHRRASFMTRVAIANSWKDQCRPESGQLHDH
ncbi:MAG: polysaccharide deacetylase family protein [Endozoicomonas sp.]